MRTRVALAFILAVVVTAVTPLAAQSAATVPATSTVYDQLEAITVRVPRRGFTLGQRPISQGELRRVLRGLESRYTQLSSQLSDADRAYIRRNLDFLSSALAADSSADSQQPLRVSWRAESYATSAPWERIANNGLGQIDAVTHPFARLRNGWPATPGVTLNVAPTIVYGVGDKVAFAIEPIGSLFAPRDSASHADALLNRWYARGVWQNAALQIGREEWKWGQSPFGSVFISGNAPPVPGISLSTDTPITLPWLLRTVGPTRFTVFFSDLGATYDPPHTKFVGWRVTFQPVERFEISVVTVERTGAKSATLVQHLIDILPVVDFIVAQNLELADRDAGGDLRLRIPELSGLDVYYEMNLDDFDARRLWRSFIDDGVHVLGARLPLTLGGETLVLRGEVNRTSMRIYEHTTYVSGATYRQRIMGDPIGTHARAQYGSATWERTPQSRIELAVANESRDPSLYAVAVTGPRDRGFHFYPLTDDPNYRTVRTTLSAEELLLGHLVRAMVGHARSWRVGFAARNDWLAQVTFTVRAPRLF